MSVNRDKRGQMLSQAPVWNTRRYATQPITILLFSKFHFDNKSLNWKDDSKQSSVQFYLNILILIVFMLVELLISTNHTVYAVHCTHSYIKIFECFSAS